MNLLNKLTTFVYFMLAIPVIYFVVVALAKFSIMISDVAYRIGG